MLTEGTRELGYLFHMSILSDKRLIKPINLTRKSRYLS
jgi:hypothetical protein